MLEERLLTGLIGLLTGIIGSFIGFTCWPWLRRCWVRWGLRVTVEDPISGAVRCRVINGSSFTMGKVLVYITLEHNHEDVMSPPGGREAFMKPHDLSFLYQGQLCWSVKENGKNPMKLDIYSGEEQPLTLGYICPEWIEILSEMYREPARAFLVRQAYTGHLKVVSLDCPAKEFAIRIDPEAPRLLIINPVSTKLDTSSNTSK